MLPYDWNFGKGKREVAGEGEAWEGEAEVTKQPHVIQHTHT